MRDQPLNGIRVVAFGMGVVTPVAGKELGLLGAEVIHIESTKRPEVTRFGTHLDNRPVGQFWNKSARYNTQNTNKKSLTLDLSGGRGQQIAKQLISLSDVVIENWAPRVKNNLGLNYEELRKIKPDIILVSASGYGASGPWVDWVAWGTATEPMCGLAHLTGFPDGPPIKGTIPMTDFIAAGYVTLAVLAALEYRRRTGSGQWIDLSEYETGILHIGEAIMDYTMNERVQTRIGNRHTFMAPHGCYRCKGNDKWVVIAVTSDEDWTNLCCIMGKPTLAKDERFSDRLSRYENQDAVDKLIEEWTVDKDHYEVMEMVQKAGIPAGAVLSYKDILLDTHMKERNCFSYVTHPKVEGMEDLGTRPYPGLPWKLSKGQIARVQPAPRLGEHNKYVLGELLGMSEIEIVELEKQGIIGYKPLAAEQPGVTQAYDISQMMDAGIVRDYDPNYAEILGLCTEPFPE